MYSIRFNCFITYFQKCQYFTLSPSLSKLTVICCERKVVCPLLTCLCFSQRPSYLSICALPWLTLCLSSECVQAILQREVFLLLMSQLFLCFAPPRERCAANNILLTTILKHIHSTGEGLGPTKQ